MPDLHQLRFLRGLETTGIRGRTRRAAGTLRSVIARSLGIHAAAGRGRSS
jgi:hypothetical protein